MRHYQKHLSWKLLAGSIGVACSVALAQEAAPLPPQTVAEPKPQPPATSRCEVDLRIPGLMSGIISSVLTRAEHKPGSEVRTFLKDAERRYATGDDLRKAAAEHFKIDQKKLASLVEHWRHINCEHAAILGYAVPDAVALAQEAAPPATSRCEADLSNAGTMKDVISNVLRLAKLKPASEYQPFLDDAVERYATSDDLLK